MNQADILIIGVIYNTYQETLRYLNSLALVTAENIVLILTDNSDIVQPPDFLSKIKDYPFLHYLKPGKNLGYFRGAQEGLNYYLQKHPSYPGWILVTNVDIVFTPQFFQRLTQLNHQQNLGIVAPSIISQKWNTDYNPKILMRYSKRKLLFFRLLYSCFLFHNLYLLAGYSKKWGRGLRRREKSVAEYPVLKGRKIYAPHGSCLVFKNNYFTLGGTLGLPNFLFGEEIFVAETAVRLGLDVIYDPGMVIHDYEHASIGFFVTPVINKHYRESINAILERYYQ